MKVKHSLKLVHVSKGAQDMTPQRHPPLLNIAMRDSKSLYNSQRGVDSKVSNRLYYNIQLGYSVDPPSGVIHGQKEVFESVAQTCVLLV